MATLDEREDQLLALLDELGEDWILVRMIVADRIAIRRGELVLVECDTNMPGPFGRTTR